MNELNYVKELVSIKSYSLTENKQIIEYLKKVFEPNSQEIMVVNNKTNNKQNILIGINTKLKNATDAIVLSGHIDTVVADEQNYKTNPYQATEIDDKIYGLGVIDMKCYFGTILDNIKILKSCKKPVIVAITSDEETEFDGVVNVVNKMRELNIKSKFSLIGEPTNLTLCTAGKCCYEYQIDIEGKSCHSSNPANGVNANYVAANLILTIEDLNTKFKNTTMTCNVMSGGEKTNIVSGNATMKFDLRTDNLETTEKVETILSQKIEELKLKYLGCNIQMRKCFTILPYNNFKSDKLIKQIESELNLSTAYFQGGCEAGYYQSLGGEALVFGCGDLSLAHKPNEFLEISKYNQYDKYFKKIIFILEND